MAKLKFDILEENKIVLIRGAGDLASGVALKLHNSGFLVVMAEIAAPSSIRRVVSFSEAVYEGQQEIEGVKAVLAKSDADIVKILKSGSIAVVVDPEIACLKFLKPKVLIDAIMAKRKTSTDISMAELSIALGPGFEAGKDVKAVIETMRGHYLGRIIWQGSAIPNTGIPGLIKGVGAQRVMHSPKAGKFRALKSIGDYVDAGETIAEVDGSPIQPDISGVIRGLLPDGFKVPSAGFKCADVDPRSEEAKDYIKTVSDKARCIAGGVLECILSYREKHLYLKNQETELSKDGIDIYIDGSCNADASCAGWGMVVVKGDATFEFSGAIQDEKALEFRNIAGEIMASKQAMSYCLKNGIKKLNLYFDYMGIRCWCTKEWRCKNELTQEYKKFYDEEVKGKLEINWMKVPAHSGVKYNELADALAKRALSSR